MGRWKLLVSSVKDEIASFAFWQAIVCEVLGTAFLVGMAGMVSTNASTNGSPTLMAALCIGLTLMGIIEMVGHISGAHVNPIITMAFLIDGQVSPFRAICYLPVQMLGSVIGASFAYGISSEKNRALIGGPSINPELTPVQGLFVEVFISMFLVMVTLGTTDGKLRPVFVPSLAVGMSVATSIMATANLSGGCMNPVASFGPAVVSGNWANHWVYWVGPLAASVVGTIIYKCIFTFKAKKRRDVASMDKELLIKLIESLDNSERNEELVRMLQNEVNTENAPETVL